jgi:hypothetical protein
MKGNNSTDRQNAPISDGDARLLRQLRANPLMAERFRQIMDRFEQEVSGGMDADEAEMMAIEEVGQLGHSILGQWADKSHDAVVHKAREDDPSPTGNGKKNSGGIPLSGPSP